MKKVSTPNAPAAIGPYTQAVISNGMLYTSGQIPLDPKTGEVIQGDMIEQTRRVMENLGEVLKAGGTDFTHAVKTTCYLSDMFYFTAFNEVYAEYFTGCPARSCVAVRTLPKDVMVEVEVIAEIPGSVQF